jgi:hypothetical protein
MSSFTACENLKTIFAADTELSTRLVGGIWTRRIMRNVAQGSVPTEGSTPEAFDDQQRIRIAMSILPTASSDIPAAGPLDAWIGGIALWVWCLPHASKKAIVDEVFRHIERSYNRVPVELNGTPVLIRPAGRIGFVDDPDLLGAVVDRLLIQIDAAQH